MRLKGVPAIGSSRLAHRLAKSAAAPFATPAGLWCRMLVGDLTSMQLKIWLATGLMLVCGVATAQAAAQTAKRISGVAAYYDTNYKGRTASGERYDPNKFTAAHKTLPFGTRLHVTAKNGRSVTVVVNDRGPFNKGRMLDLSLAAAKALRMTGRGLMRVTAEVQPASFTTAASPPAR